MTTLHVYRVDKMSLSDFVRARDGQMDRRDVWECVEALRAVLATDAEMPIADMPFAEFWFAGLPMVKRRVIILRVNPHDSGYVVSPVELPWLGVSLEPKATEREP